MNLKICVFQFDIQWLDPQANIQLIEEHLRSLDSPIDLLVLPEMYLTGFCMTPTKSVIQEDGPEFQILLELSKKYHVGLMGSLAIQDEDTFCNRVHLITPQGIAGRYDKQYLYSPSGENLVFGAKYDTNLFSFKGYTMLPQVCYDLRFPENVRPHPAPDVLVYMANWPTPRVHHWDELLKARAIENQCFVIGCNRLGKDGNDWDYPGHSVMIKPDGTTVNLDTTTTQKIVEVSKSEMEQYRSKYRFLDDKKVRL